jgi:hypothetical protein
MGREGESVLRSDTTAIVQDVIVSLFLQSVILIRNAPASQLLVIAFWICLCSEARHQQGLGALKTLYVSHGS